MQFIKITAQTGTTVVDLGDLGDVTPTPKATPKRIVLTEDEMWALLSLMRMTPDDFRGLEEGAAVPLGTLDGLERRVRLELAPSAAVD